MNQPCASAATGRSFVLKTVCRGCANAVPSSCSCRDMAQHSHTTLGLLVCSLLALQACAARHQLLEADGPGAAGLSLPALVGASHGRRLSQATECLATVQCAAVTWVGKAQFAANQCIGNDFKTPSKPMSDYVVLTAVDVKRTCWGSPIAAVQLNMAAKKAASGVTYDVALWISEWLAHSGEGKGGWGRKGSAPLQGRQRLHGRPFWHLHSEWRHTVSNQLVGCLLPASSGCLGDTHSAGAGPLVESTCCSPAQATTT